MTDKIPESLNKFKAQLERALEQELERAPTAGPLRRVRPRTLVGTTLVLAGLAVVLTLVFTAASSPPAFAVTHNRDGTVSVKLMRLEGLHGANAALAQMHVRVKLVRLAATCSGPPPGPPRNLTWRGSQARIKPWRIPRGRTLVIGVRKDGRMNYSARVAVGAGPDCMQVIPPSCRGPKGNHSNRAIQLTPPAPPDAAGNRTVHQLPAPSCQGAPQLSSKH